MIFLNLAAGLFLLLLVVILPGACLTFVRLAYCPAAKLRLQTLDWVEWCAYSLIYGLVFVGSIAFIMVGFAGIFMRVFVNAWMLAAIALAIVATCLGWLWWVEVGLRGRKLSEIVRSTRHWRKVVSTAPGAGWVLAAALLVALFYLINYDRYGFDEERCLIRAAVLPVHNYLGFDTPMSWSLPEEAVTNNAFLHWNGGQRLGSAVFSGFALALFGFAGFQLTHALCGLFIFLGTFLAARETTERPGAALFGALALSLSPFLIQIDTFDENLLAAALAAVALPLLLRQRRDVLAVGALFALFVGVRHVGILWAPGILAYLWLSRKPEKNPAGEMVTFGICALLFMSPYIYKHARDLELYALPYESFLSNPPVPHSFLGLEFNWRGLLNWPFVPDLVRSPFSPYPPAIGLPLTIVSRFGVLLTALSVAGLTWTFRRNWKDGLLLLSLLAPVALILALQSNWVEPAKMFVLVTVIPPMGIWLASGVAWSLDHKLPTWQRYTLPAAAVVVVWTGVHVAGSMEYPLDRRNLTYRKVYLTAFRNAMLPEQDEYLELRSAKLSRGNLLPSADSVSLCQSSRLFKRRLRHTWQDLTRPAVEDVTEPVANRFRRIQGFAELMHFPVTSMAGGNLESSPKIRWPKPGDLEFRAVAFDFSLPLVLRSDFIRIATAKNPPLKLEPGKAMVIRGLEVPWAGRMANLVLSCDHELNVSAILMFEAAPGEGLDSYGVPGAASDGFLPAKGPGDKQAHPNGHAHFPSAQRLAKEMGEAVRLTPIRGAYEPDLLTEMTLKSGASPTVTIQMPVGTLMDFSEMTSFAPNLSFRWYVEIDEVGNVELDPPTAIGM